MASLTLKDLPDALLRDLRKAAAADRRSMAQEIIHLLEAALRERADRATPPVTIRFPVEAVERDPPPGDHLASGQPLELIVLACKSNALRCRAPGSDRELTLRTPVRNEVPGEIITVAPSRQWSYAGSPYISGNVQGSRLDVPALGLVPLALRAEGEWDPADESWGEGDESIDERVRAIFEHGARPQFEMEQILPGEDPDDSDSDPIIDASELHGAGAVVDANKLLMSLLAEDLRCLDAHAHLGNFAFDHRPKVALRHYAVGVGIGELSLGAHFDGVLSWGFIDNRPYLRCLHGLGLALWRTGDRARAADVFRRMLWLNPGDHQGARFNLAAVQAGKSWEELERGR